MGGALATTHNPMKRMRSPQSPADYRASPGAEIGRPSDFWILGRSRGSAAGADGPGGDLANWKHEPCHH